MKKSILNLETCGQSLAIALGDPRDGVEIFGEDYPSPFEDAVILTMDGVTTVSLAAL